MSTMILNRLERHAESTVDLRDGAVGFSKARENALIAAYQDSMVMGQPTKAIEHLLVEHRPMLAKLVKDELMVYTRAVAHPILTSEDMMQVAIEEFCRAALKHDRSETRLATFAAYHVKGALGSYVRANLGPVRVGTNVHDRKAIVGFFRARAFIHATLHRDITEADAPMVARYAGVDEYVAVRIIRRLTAPDIPVDLQYQPDGRAYEPYPDTGRYLVRDAIPIEPSQAEYYLNDDPLDRTVVKVDGARMMALLATLPARERAIVQAFVEADGRPDTRALAARFRRTPTRIRQIYRAALRALRAIVEGKAPMPDPIRPVARDAAPPARAKLVRSPRPAPGSPVPPDIRPVAATPKTDHAVTVDRATHDRIPADRALQVRVVNGVVRIVKAPGVVLKDGAYRLVPEKG